jgi:hypothetical protein
MSSANANNQSQAYYYQTCAPAGSTYAKAKKLSIRGDRSASSRTACTRGSAQATVRGTYTAGFYQKYETERNSTLTALSRTRGGGAVVPPKCQHKPTLVTFSIINYEPPKPPVVNYNVPWTPINTDILGFPFNGAILEMEASDSGQYMAMIAYTYYNAILPQYYSVIYISSDYGYSWLQSVQENTYGYGYNGYSFYSISRNGQYQVFLVTDNSTDPGSAYGIMISADYGQTWTKTPIASSIDVPTTCISNDGQTVIVGQKISFDGAQTFTQMFTDSGGSSGTGSFSAVMSANAPYTIAVETANNIWISRDGGHQFTVALSVNDPVVGEGVFTGSIAMTADGKNIYVSKGDEASNASIMYTSQDYGVNWSHNVPVDITTGNPIDTVFWTKRSISSDGQRQVASMINRTGTGVFMYYSTNAGQTWLLLDQPMPPALNWAYTPILTDRGLVNYTDTAGSPFFGTVYVYPPPANAEPVGINHHPWRAIVTDAAGVNFQGTYVTELASSATGQYVTILIDYYVYVSHDYGRTWRQTNSNIQAIGYMSDMYSYMSVSRNGKFQIIMDLKQNNIHVSSDYGMTWVNKPLPVDVNPSVCICDDGRTIYFGNQYSADGGNTFAPIPFVGMPAGVDLATVVTTANSVSYDKKYITLTDHTAGRIYVSNNSGQTFQVITTYINPVDSSTHSIPGRFTGSACMSYNGEYQYLTCFNPSIFFMSQNYGATWYSVDARDDNGNPMPSNYYWTKRTIDPSTLNQIICNTNAFHAYYSTDGGVNWKQLVNAYSTYDPTNPSEPVVNALTPIISTQSVMNTWKNKVYIYP